MARGNSLSRKVTRRISRSKYRSWGKKLSTHWNKPSWAKKRGFGLGMYTRKGGRRKHYS